jgi:hypothetical protein
VTVTRYATVRLLAAAVFGVLIVSATTALAEADGGVGVGSVLLACLLGIVGFAVLAVALLFDSRRRHQLGRVIGSLVSTDRLVMRLRRTAGEREPRDEQVTEMRRRLDYALEGLRRSVGSEPAAVGASSGAPLMEDARTQGTLVLDLPGPPRVVEPALEISPSLGIATWSVDDGLRQPRPPVSHRVAHGAPLVRLGVDRHHRGLVMAAAHARLIELRADDHRLRHRAAVSRWVLRAVVLLIVPAALVGRASLRSSWLGDVWDGRATRPVFVAALVLAAAASFWTLVVTRREHGLREGPRTSSEAHAVRSLLTCEQLALRLSAGVAPADAWQVVARNNHFPPGSAMPAADVEQALGLVEQLRRGARRRQMVPVRRRVASVLRPLLICLLCAAVVIVLH